jgi:signal transduction histidine kinase
MTSSAPSSLGPSAAGPACAARRHGTGLGVLRLRTDYTGLRDDHRSLLGRQERAAWAVVLVLLGLYAVVDLGTERLVGDPTAQILWRLGLLATLGVGAVLVSCRVLLDRAAAQFRLHEATRAAEDDAARLQGALLAINTMQHHLGNRLALTRGYAELLAANPRLPNDVQQAAREALRGAVDAVNVLDGLQTLTRLETDHTLKGPAVLDLQRSRGAPRDEAASA